MAYDDELPTVQDYQDLSRQLEKYPAKRDECIWLAERCGLNTAMIHLLAMFPVHTCFAGPDDLMTRCEELALLINEKRALPWEPQLSPQD